MGSLVRRIDLPNGKSWDVGYIGLLYVMVPVDEIKDMTDSEIGHFVRALIPEARLTKALVTANQVDCLIAADVPQSLLLEALNELNEFREQAPEIDQAITRIEKRLKVLKTRKAKQALSQQRRTQFQKAKARLMLALIARDGYECATCGAQKDITIDHVIPLSRGGTDDLENLVLLCRTCNSKKGDNNP